MTQLEKLENALNKKLVKLLYNESKTEITFEETQENVKLKSLTIKNLPTNALAFTCDVKEEGITNQFLDDSCAMEGINKGCDLVIIFEKEENLHAIFGEMKSFNFSKSDYQPQLQNSYLLVDYIRRMISLFDNENIELKTSFYLFYLFENRKQTKSNKNRTLKRRTHSNPEKAITNDYKKFDKSAEGSTHYYKLGFFAPRKNIKYNRKINFEDLISSKK